MTNEDKIAHLKKLCSFYPQWNAALGAPFLFAAADGESWSMASDGRMLFAWRGKLDGVEERKGAPKIPQDWIAGALAASKEVAADALRAWAGAATFPAMKACPECKGTGVVEHFCECHLCEEPEEDCVECDGRKQLLTEDIRPGVIGGAGVDRNFFAMVLDGIEGTVHIDTGKDEYDQIRMSGVDWFAIVMPRRLEPEEIEAAPSLAL